MAESMLPRLRAGLLEDRAPRPSTESEGLELIEAAAQQGLLGWLAPRAREAGGFTHALQRRLDDLERLLVARGLQQLDRAGQVQERLLAQGLRVLPLKGAAVAERLYASVAERAMGDVDLLALDAWPETVRALLELGFERAATADHAWSFRDRLSGQVFELHHAVTSCPGLFPLDTAGLWARRRAGDGYVRQLPGDEDLLVQLALHAAFQHGLVLSLGQYLDFRRLREQELNFDELLARAQAGRALSALTLALFAADAAVGTELPVEWNRRLREALRPGLQARLARACAHPLELIHPARPRLIWARLTCAHGQKLRFLWLSLRLAPGSAEGGGLRRFLRLARFALASR